MARLRTPSSILEFKGAFKKNPQRKRAGEPKPTTSIGPPPKRLKGKDRKAWLEIIKQCHPGVLTGMDRAALEIMAVCVASLWDNKEASITSCKTVFGMLGRFGMTPGDRASLSIAPTDKPGDFDGFP